MNRLERETEMKSRCFLLLGLMLLVIAQGRSSAGPVTSVKPFHLEIAPEEPLERKWKFKGGERAGVMVMVKSDLSSKTNVLIEVRDAKGQLITEDKAGGPFASVIWYPPHDAEFQVKITLKGGQAKTCYIVVR
jgi:hypothetical protein